MDELSTSDYVNLNIVTTIRAYYKHFLLLFYSEININSSYSQLIIPVIHLYLFEARYGFS